MFLVVPDIFKSFLLISLMSFLFFAKIVPVISSGGCSLQCSIAKTVLDVVWLIMINNTLKYPSILPSWRVRKQNEEISIWKFLIKIAFIQSFFFPQKKKNRILLCIVFFSFFRRVICNFAAFFEFCLLVILVYYFHVYFNLKTNGQWKTAIAQILN